MKSRKNAIPRIILALVLTGLVTLAGGKTLANGYMGGSKNDDVVEKLAQKLNISQDQVSSAINQIREDRRIERQTQISANLDEAVADGVITVEQKQTILDKKAENQKQSEARRAVMEQWRIDSGIDWDKLRSYSIGGVGAGKGMRDGHGKMYRNGSGINQL